MSKRSKTLARSPSYLNPNDGDIDDFPAILTTRGSECPLDFDPNDPRVQNLFASQVPQQQKKKEKEELLEVIPNRYIQSLTEVKEQKVVFKPTNVSKVHTTQERIEQVQNGSYIHLCITNGSQNLANVTLELQNENGLFEFTIVKNYEKTSDGTLEMINKYLLKKQKQVLGYLIKQFGSAIMCGKSIMSISLPIGIFEPRSLLERIADSFAFAPHFLEKGGLTADPLEQFRLAVTFYLTTLATDLNPEKPFNPILGETFQAVIGGCPIYMEQISHHPPLALYQMFGKNFKMEGYFEETAAISANSVKCRKIGDFKIVFKNTGTVIQVQFPVGVMSGTAFGKRVWQFTKKLQVYDFKNGYYAEIDFDKSESCKKRKELAGYFSNNIYKMTDKFALKAQQDLQKQKDVEIKFKEKDHSAAKLDSFDGSWLESISFNGQVYWSQANPWPYKVKHFDNPLPSDCNFRMDLLYLKAGDEIKAQDSKVHFEEFQRKDKKLREQKLSKQYK